MDQAIAIIELGSVIVAVIAVLAHVKGVRKQTEIQTFINLSEQFARIYDRRPNEIRIAHPAFQAYDITAEKTKDPHASHQYLQDFFTLIFREFNLYKSGAIDKRIWKSWCKHLRVFMSRGFYREGWKQRWREHFLIDRDFVGWIDKIARRGARRQ